MENQRMLGIEEAVVFGTEGGPGPTGVPNTTAAAEAARGSGPRTGVNGQGPPDPAVLERPMRRRFDAEYKPPTSVTRTNSPSLVSLEPYCGGKVFTRRTCPCGESSVTRRRLRTSCPSGEVGSPIRMRPSWPRTSGWFGRRRSS